MRPFIIVLLSLGTVFAGIVENHQPQPYRFGYESQDEWGNAQSRHEEDLGDGSKRGSFGYRDAHGMFRLVNYVADHDGFRAWVKTNEPGTKDSAPAAARIEKTSDSSDVVIGKVPITVEKSVVAPVAASPVSSYIAAPYVSQRKVIVPEVSYAAAPVYTRPVRYYGQRQAHAAPLVLSASHRQDTPVVFPVPVRKLVGPSAASYVAAHESEIQPKFASLRYAPSSPVINSGNLYAESSENVAYPPVLSHSVRPYEKFAETFRRRRPIKTIGEHEIEVGPSVLTANGVPVYKD